MKHLNQTDLHQVYGGSNNEECESFKQDLKDAMQSAADKIGDGANSLADKINELLEKHKSQ